MKSLGLLVAGTFCFCVVVAFTLNSLSAQNTGSAKQAEKNSELFAPVPLEDFAYADDQSGCVKEMLTYSLLLGKFKDGESLAEASGNNKMLSELFEKKYAKLRDVGAKKLNVDMMKSYSECMEKSPVVKNKRGAKYEACAKLHDGIMDVLRSIKNRAKASTVAAKYENNKLDLSETAYGDFDNAMSFFTQSLYRVANEDGYDKALEQAVGISATCGM